MSFSGLKKPSYQQRDDSYLFEIDKVLSQHILSTIENYATSLTNKLIINLDMDSLCVDGICYYSKCEGVKCEIEYCKYIILKGENKCSTKISMGIFKLDRLSNKNLPLDDQNKHNTAVNSEENDIQLIHRILHK